MRSYSCAFSNKRNSRYDQDLLIFRMQVLQKRLFIRGPIIFLQLQPYLNVWLTGFTMDFSKCGFASSQPAALRFTSMLITAFAGIFMALQFQDPYNRPSQYVCIEQLKVWYFNVWCWYRMKSSEKNVVEINLKLISNKCLIIALTFSF